MGNNVEILNEQTYQEVTSSGIMIWIKQFLIKYKLNLASSNWSRNRIVSLRTFMFCDVTQLKLFVLSIGSTSCTSNRCLVLKHIFQMVWLNRVGSDSFIGNDILTNWNVRHFRPLYNHKKHLCYNESLCGDTRSHRKHTRLCYVVATSNTLTIPYR